MSRCGDSARRMESALGRFVRPAHAAWLVMLLAVAPAGGAADMPAQGNAPDPERLQQEAEQLASVGDGIGLTLAACDEEPHCVQGIAQHEIVRALDLILNRIDTLAAAQEAGEATTPQESLLARYEQLRDRYADYLRQYHQVTQRVDIAELEGDWEDQLEFNLAPEPTGPDVPEPNRRTQLRRFQDADDPLPVD